MDSSCSRLLKIRPWIVSASALFRARMPVEMAVVEPAGIRSLGRVCFIGVVVELSDFITASKYRNSRKGKKQCMKCYVISDSAADTICISFIIKTLDSCKRCGCSAELRFFVFRIYINLAPGKGIREKTGEEFIQIISVRAFCDKAVLSGNHSPGSNVQCCGYGGNSGIPVPAEGLQLCQFPAEKGSVLCGNGMPEIGHQRVLFTM